MPLDMDTSPKKMYYSISEVANMLQVKTSLIRFWEKEIPQLSPQKSRKGNRKFNNKDIELLSIIHRLVKKQGYTLEGAKQALQKDTQTLREHHKHLQALKELHHFLCQLRQALQQK